MCESGSSRALAPRLSTVVRKWRLLALACMFLGTALGSDVEAGTDDVSLLENGLQLRDCLLPEPELNDADLTWGVSVRVLPAFEPEWLVILRAEKSGRFVGELLRPTDYRIVDQSESLGEGITCTHARETLEIVHCTADDNDSTGLRPLASEFQQQNWPARPAIAFIFDGTQFEVRARGPQEQHRLFLVAPPDDEKTHHPVIHWAESLRDELRCQDQSTRRSSK